MNLNAKNVFGVLVTYNPNIPCLHDVVFSIMKQLPLLIIVDNGSKNKDEICAICDSNKSIQLVDLDENIGLASAQNIGIRQAKKNNATHIILFDQDSVIDDSFVCSLLYEEEILLNRSESVAAVGPSFYDPVSKLIYPATVYSGPFIQRVSLDNHPIKATFVIASGCLIRISILDEIGMMREELFIDYIDVEWCLRAKYKGYSVFISPNAKMAHAIGDSRKSILGRTISLHSAIRRYYLVRNSFFMLRLSYIPVGYKIRELIFNFFRIVTGIYFSSEKIRTFLYALGGIKDGVSGRFGPCKYNW